MVKSLFKIDLGENLQQRLGLRVLSPQTLSGVITTLFKKLLARNPFQKRLDRKLQQRLGLRDHNPFQKRLDRKLQQQRDRCD